MEATAPQLLKSRSAVGGRGRDWEKELPEQKLGGWLRAGPGGLGVKLEEVQTMMGGEGGFKCQAVGSHGRV